MQPKTQVRMRAGSPIEAELAVDQGLGRSPDSRVIGLEVKIAFTTVSNRLPRAHRSSGYVHPSKSNSDLPGTPGSLLGVHSCGTVADLHRLPLARRTELYPGLRRESIGKAENAMGLCVPDNR